MKEELSTFALRLLNQKQYSRNQLRQKLVRKLPDAENLVDSYLDELESWGLLNDERLAESICRGLALKGKGPLQMKQKLFSKGLLEYEYLTHEFEELALEHFSKQLALRFPNCNNIDKLEPKEIQRLMRWIQSRGFLKNWSELLAEYGKAYEINHW